MYRILIMLLILPLGLWSQEEEIKVHAETAVKSFYLGEAFTLNVMVSGNDKVKAPETDLINDFVVKKISEMPVAHKDKKGFIIRYKMLPKREGSLLIPALGVKVDGDILETNEMRISVKRPLTHEGLKVEVHLSQSEAFVGEPIIATFTLTSELPLYAFNAVDISYPFLTHYAFRTYNTHDTPKSGDRNSIGLPVSNTRIIALRGKKTIGEKSVDLITFKKVLIPSVAGEIELKPATFLASFTPPPKQVSSRRNWQPQYPSHFNNNFFEEVEGKNYEKYFASSESIKLIVKDLPTAGKPADFNGLVGKCEIALQAQPTIIEAGAPVSMKVTISGHEYPTIPELPELGEQLAFNRNFSIPSRQSSGKVENKQKVFLRTVRPLRTDVSEIPPIRIPYFDPQTGTYGIAQTKAIPLTVKPAKTVTAFDADLSGGKILKNKLEKNKEGIHHNSLSLEALKKQKVVSPFLVISFVLPPVLFLVFMMMTAEARLKLNDPVAARRKFAFKNCQQKVSKAENVRELEIAVRTFIADSLNLTVDAHTYKEVVEAFQDLPKLKELYDFFDTDRYSDGGAGDFTKLKSESEKVINSLKGRIANA